jgi:branched-chain amino acid transport system permease protein
VTDIVLSGQLLAAALVTSAIYALVALGLNLIYGTMRLLNIAHGDLVMIGAYVAFYGFTWAGLPPLAALPLAVLLGAGVGWALYALLFRRLLARSSGTAAIEANSMLMFFGVSVVIQNVAVLAFTANSRSYQYLDGIVTIGSAAITQGRLVALAIAVAVCAAVVLFLRRSIHGLAMKALIESRPAAAVVGIDIDRVQRATFLIGFGIAALAGVLVSLTEQISPFMGFPYTIAAFVVIILGGLGNLAGGIAAAALFGAIETYGVALVSPSYRSLMVYGVFILILLVRPQGLLTRVAR